MEFSKMLKKPNELSIEFLEEIDRLKKVISDAEIEHISLTCTAYCDDFKTALKRADQLIANGSASTINKILVDMAIQKAREFASQSDFYEFNNTIDRYLTKYPIPNSQSFLTENWLYIRLSK